MQPSQRVIELRWHHGIGKEAPQPERVSVDKHHFGAYFACAQLHTGRRAAAVNSDGLDGGSAFDRSARSDGARR